VFRQRGKLLKGLRLFEQSLFLASDQDAHCCGECDTQQLARVDPILVVDADHLSLLVECQRDRLCFSPAQAEICLQFRNDPAILPRPF
jgi:hypothetical protein